MNAVSRLLTSVASAFEFNQATLSGCVDIIVIKQRDGTLKSTPFHVRFGKLKILKSKDKFVSIRVNNNETGLRMKLGEAGEGFFEREVLKDHNNSTTLNMRSSQKAVSAMEIERPASQAPKLCDLLNLNEPVNSNESNNSSSKSSPEVQVCVGGSDAMEIEDSEDGNLDEFLLLSQPLTKSESQPAQLSGGKSENQLPHLSHSLSSNLLSKNSSVKKIKVRTLRPSSDMLQSLNLKNGCNSITYTVKSSLQGSQTLTGHIYYWNADSNIIISDIDGTITKTDFLGHLMPMVGKDWSQPGIAPLFSNIRRNGYHILYLTSRPIGQAQQTKEFLHSIYQDGKMLPHGPLIMSPDRMFPSVKRELIFKRPELFKMAVLKDIRSLFPQHHNPFHAGFGNRETDAIAYNSVGIPLEKVYIVNPKGDIHHHNTQPMKSYALINTMVKEMFPDILRDPKLKLAESLDEENALRIDDERLMAQNVAKVVA